jgi:hypothetical protein
MYAVDVKEESEKNTKIFEALYSRAESCEYLSPWGVSYWLPFMFVLSFYSIMSSVHIW